jgi:hypothetical protein
MGPESGSGATQASSGDSDIESRFEIRALLAVASHLRRDRLGRAQWNVADGCLAGAELEPRPHAGGVRGEHHVHRLAALGTQADLDLGDSARPAPPIPRRDHFDVERVGRPGGAGQPESKHDCSKATEQPHLPGANQHQHN